MSSKVMQWLQSGEVTPQCVARSNLVIESPVGRLARRCTQRMQRAAPAPAQPHRVASLLSVSPVPGLLNPRRRTLELSLEIGSNFEKMQSSNARVRGCVLDMVLCILRIPLHSDRVRCLYDALWNVATRLRPRHYPSSTTSSSREEAQPVGTCA